MRYISTGHSRFWPDEGFERRMPFTKGSIAGMKVRVVGVIRESWQLVALQGPELETMVWE